MRRSRVGRSASWGLCWRFELLRQLIGRCAPALRVRKIDGRFVLFKDAHSRPFYRALAALQRFGLLGLPCRLALRSSFTRLVCLIFRQFAQPRHRRTGRHLTTGGTAVCATAEGRAFARLGWFGQALQFLFRAVHCHLEYASPGCLASAKPVPCLRTSIGHASRTADLCPVG